MSSTHANLSQKNLLLKHGLHLNINVQHSSVVILNIYYLHGYQAPSIRHYEDGIINAYFKSSLYLFENKVSKHCFYVFSVQS